jgi:hypothetical protein
MDTIRIPIEEFNSLQAENKLLKEQDFLVKVNQLIDILFERKYGLYLGDFTYDLSEVSALQVKEWSISGDVWNEV